MKRLAEEGLLLAAALIMSYIETLIPFAAGVPGMKLGLPNLVVLLMLFWNAPAGKEHSPKGNTAAALRINLLRILLSGFLYGNLFSILYSLAGALFSFCAMLAGQHMKRFSVLGVSILGGIFHNLGQLAAACLVLGADAVIFYAPALILSGILTGAALGVIALVILPYRKHFEN